MRERLSNLASLRARDVSPQDQGRLAALLATTVGLSVAFAAFLAYSGYFGSDLFSFRDAQKDGLTLGYLFRPVFDHFIPGHRFVNWFVQSVDPLSWPLAVAILVLTFAATVLVIHRLLAELYRPGWGALLLAFFFGASAINVGTGLWWAAGLSRLPASLFGLLAMLWYLRFRRTNRSVYLVASVAALGTAMLFSEDAALLLPELVALRVFVLYPDESFRDAVRGAIAEWWVWVPYLIPVGIGIIGSTSQTAAASDWHSPISLLRYLATAWFQSFCPATLGLYVNNGPLSAAEIASIVAGQLAVLGLAGWSVFRRREAWRAWAFFGFGFLATQMPVGLVRTGFFTPELVAHQYRYYSQTIALFAITLGAAFLPIRSAERRDDAGAGDRAGDRLPAPQLAAVVAVAAVYLATSLVMAGRLTDANPGRRAGPYLRNLQHDLADLRGTPGGFALLDSVVPNDLTDAIYAPDNRLRDVVPLIGSGYRFATDTSKPLYRADADGHLEKVTFKAVAGGPADNLVGTPTFGVSPPETIVSTDDGRVCVQSGKQQSTVGLELPSLATGGWYLRVRYTTRTPGFAHVLADHGAGFKDAAEPTLPIVAGQGESVASLGRAPLAAVFFVLQPDVGACFTDITIGLVEPA